MVVFAVGYAQEDTLSVRLFYRMQGKFIINRELTYRPLPPFAPTQQISSLPNQLLSIILHVLA